MVRSPPPPAIHPPLASATAIGEGTPKLSSDLPLRNYTSAPQTTSTTISQAASPNQARLPPTPPHHSAGIFSDVGRAGATPTPSSTVAEFGDRIFFANKSAVSLVENVGRSYSRNRSRSEASGANSLSQRQARSRSRSNTPTPTPTPTRGGNYTPRSARSQSTSHHRQTSSRDQGITTNEKVNRFLHSISNTPPPQESQTELLLENRSLHQRISALQRNESDLLEQNQRLAHQLESMKKQYDARIRQWKDEVREGRKKLQDRIKDLETEVEEKDQRLQDLGLDDEPVLSDEDIMAWFAERTKAWHVWTEEFGHRDPKRVQTGLHPLQLRELCEGVKGFVSLTDGDKLPDELLNGIGDGKAKAAHVLLYGMLSHFIIFEALQSPFWVFEAFSGTVLELESPIVPKNNSMSPVGFRMDLAMWNNIATLGNDHAHNWRRQLMRTLSRGGLMLDPNGAKGPDSRLLIEAREKYATKLKDRFLSGPARYLLEDQDAHGIEKLERRLLRELDLTLRFSCQVWSRLDHLKFSSLAELAPTEFNANSPIMELCEIQAPPNSQLPGASGDDLGPDAPPAYYDGNAVIMVVQPAVESIKTNSSSHTWGHASRKGADLRSIWTKAQVLVRTANMPSFFPGPREAKTSVKGPPTPLAVEKARQVCQTPSVRGSPAAETVSIPLPAHIVPGAAEILSSSVFVAPGSAPLKLSLSTRPVSRKTSSPISPQECLFKVTMLEVSTR
ncbi:hypothetical protein V8F20_004405 [Naviculisporaceae sp. PSN 640]